MKFENVSLTISLFKSLSFLISLPQQYSLNEIICVTDNANSYN
jgi:hypothetical protein